MKLDERTDYMKREIGLTLYFKFIAVFFFPFMVFTVIHANSGLLEAIVGSIIVLVFAVFVHSNTLYEVYWRNTVDKKKKKEAKK